MTWMGCAWAGRLATPERVEALGMCRGSREHYWSEPPLDRVAAAYIVLGSGRGSQGARSIWEPRSDRGTSVFLSEYFWERGSPLRYETFHGDSEADARRLWC